VAKNLRIWIVFLIACGQQAAAQTSSEVDPLGQLSHAIRQLTNRISPSVVEILVTGYGTSDGQSGQVSNQISMQRSSGSGVVVDPSGYIMTNAHVVQGATSVKVLMTEGAAPNAAVSHTREGMVTREAMIAREAMITKDAKIIGIDADSDLALVRIDASGLRSLGFADSDEVRQGDLVFAIGSPVGLRNSLSMGVVSAPARAVDDANPIQYIQTDAPINPGNSGGALVDSRGSLIGLNAYIVSQSGGSEGIGFAIPSNVVRNVFQQLRDKGRVSRGTVGIIVQKITETMAAGLDLPKSHGIVVADVTPDGPGDRAGVKRRDVILSLDRVPLLTPHDFENAVYRRAAGDALNLVVQRDHSQLEITVKVQEQGDPTDALDTLVSPEKNLIPRLGLLCVQIDKKVADANPELRRPYGLIVAAKSSSSGQSQPIDLRENDVIHALNGQMVTDLSLFRKTIDALPSGAPVVLQVERDRVLRYVAFEIQ
jgi:serine protease Do